MPKTPRGKRVLDASTGTYRVVNKAANGQAEPYFDKSRNVWVAPWRKADGKIGRPTGKTRALAVASRDRHIAKAADEARFGALDEGFAAGSTIVLAGYGVSRQQSSGHRRTGQDSRYENVLVRVGAPAADKRTQLLCGPNFERNRLDRSGELDA